MIMKMEPAEALRLHCELAYQIDEALTVVDPDGYPKNLELYNALLAVMLLFKKVKSAS